MDIVILGCGRVGARLATTLSARHDVTVIDWNAGSFDRLGEAFTGETVAGNGIDVDVLRSSGVATADVFLAVTEGDNRNLMAGQIARQLGAGRVLVRVYDPVRCEIFRRMGLETLSPTVEGAQRLYEMVTAGGEE